MAFLFSEEWAYKIVRVVIFLEVHERHVINQRLKLLIILTKNPVNTPRRLNVYKTSIRRCRHRKDVL